MLSPRRLGRPVNGSVWASECMTSRSRLASSASRRSALVRKPSTRMNNNMSSVAPNWKECRVQKFTGTKPLITPMTVAVAKK
ncbi:hypothetical protein D3C71_1708690 [compost metagenome]